MHTPMYVHKGTRIEIFLSKVNIWNVDCARTTAFIFDTWTDVLVTVSKFWDRKCLDLRGTRTPNLRILAECSNHLSYQGQTFADPCFLNTGSGGTVIFLNKVSIWNVNCARATAFIFDIRTDVLVKVSKYLRQKMSRPEGELEPSGCHFICHFNPSSVFLYIIYINNWFITLLCTLKLYICDMSTPYLNQDDELWTITNGTWVVTSAYLFYWQILLTGCLGTRSGNIYQHIAFWMTLCKVGPLGQKVLHTLR